MAGMRHGSEVSAPLRAIVAEAGRRVGSERLMPAQRRIDLGAVAGRNPWPWSTSIRTDRVRLPILEPRRAFAGVTGVAGRHW